MKKILALLLASLMVLTLVACGASDISVSADNSDSIQQDSETQNESTEQEEENTSTEENDSSETTEVSADIAWPDNELSVLVPEPDFPLDHYDDSGVPNILTLYFGTQPFDEVATYIDELIAQGYSQVSMDNRDEEAGTIYWCGENETHILLLTLSSSGSLSLIIKTDQ